MATCGTKRQIRRNIFTFSVIFVIQLLVQRCHTAPVNNATTTHDAPNGSIAVQPATIQNQLNDTVPSPTPQKDITTTPTISKNPELVSDPKNSTVPQNAGPNASSPQTLVSGSSNQSKPESGDNAPIAANSSSETTLGSGKSQGTNQGTTNSGQTTSNPPQSDPTVTQLGMNTSSNGRIDDKAVAKVTQQAADPNQADSTTSAVTKPKGKDADNISATVTDVEQNKNSDGKTVPSEANNANQSIPNNSQVTTDPKSSTTPVQNNLTDKVQSDELLDETFLGKTEVFDASETENAEEFDKPGPTEPTDVTDAMEFDFTSLPESRGTSNKQDNEQGTNVYNEDEDEDEEEDYSFYDPLAAGSNPGQKQPKVVVTRLEPIDAEEENSHFFFHLVILAFLVAIVYITYHNKRKIFLLAQSRRWRDSLCSRNTVEYHRLDTNVNEAMPSLKITRDYIF